jgi:hypothetical protein
MTAIPTTRHDRHVRFRMVEPVPGDEARDVLGKKLVRGPSRFKDHPMIATRYRIYPQGTFPASTGAGSNDTLPPTTGGILTGNRFTPLNVTNPNDSSLNDLHIKTGDRPLNEHIAGQLRLHLGRRFDPRFIELYLDDETFLDGAIRLVQGGDGRDSVFSTYLNELNSTKSENACTPSLVVALNEIARTILESWRVETAKPTEAYRPFFAVGCDLEVKPNPGFDSVPGHGEEKYQKNIRSVSQWNNVKPDIIVWKDPAHAIERHWGNLASVCEVKNGSLGDMNTGEDIKMASLLQLAKYLVSGSKLRLGVSIRRKSFNTGFLFAAFPGV